MKKALVLVFATALVTAVGCYFLLKPKMLPRVARVMFDSPDRAFVAVVVTDDWHAHGMQMLVQSVHLVPKAEADQQPVLKPGVELGFRGHSVAAIHSCQNSDIEVRWTGPRSLLIRCAQTKPDWVSFIKVAAGVTVSIQDLGDSKSP